jgi:hypothetical protein
MATEVIKICDWHEEEVEATHHNEWTNAKGPAPIQHPARRQRMTDPPAISGVRS